METITDEVALGARGEKHPEFAAVFSIADLRARAQRLLNDQQERVRCFENNLNEQLLGVLEQLTELEQLRSERDELGDRLREAERDHASGEVDPDQQQQMRDLQDRFEMAVQEVRELKALNEQLAQQVEAKDCVSPEPSPAGGQGFDWETQKQRLLEQLESDFDSSDAEQAKDKMTVEGAIRITDQVVAEKEKEIEELKQLLDDQSNNVGAVAVGAISVAEVVDQDELVREERENLKRIQDEWHDKLRQAEVDISVERAKIARERMELDEKLRRLEAELPEGADGSGRDSDSAKKAPRGRWLTRLGLREEGS